MWNSIRNLSSGRCRAYGACNFFFLLSQSLRTGLTSAAPPALYENKRGSNEHSQRVNMLLQSGERSLGCSRDDKRSATSSAKCKEPSRCLRYKRKDNSCEVR